MTEKARHSSRKSGKEEYFTIPAVAQRCVKEFMLRFPKCKSFLDPCAGSGSFSDELENYGAVTKFDITPRSPNTIEVDFTKDNWKQLITNNVDAVITNPPFGRASNLAIQFFNQAATITDLIGFIIPSSWVSKHFIHDKLDPNFNLIYNTKLPAVSFMTPEGKDYEDGNLNCVFQIWQRSDRPRKKMLHYRSNDFEFVRPKNVNVILAKNSYDRETKPVFDVDEEKLITIRTHGSQAGKILSGIHYNPRTVAWILPKVEGVENNLRKTDFSLYFENNAYTPSLSPSEISYSYDSFVKKVSHI